ncbi:hypothetical protein CBF45_15095 [Bordetella sp. J329]|nr:hypothetical protein CBF45_15095 [Bordetella sp. J329]
MPHSDAAPQRTILLTTDLSARCDRALDRAVQLARSRQARLVALHVIEPSLTAQLITPTWRKLAPDHRSLAERRLLDDLAESGVDIEVRVEQGKALDVILQVAEETQAELVVAGVARDETLGRLLLGTTVEKLVRHIPVPVLVVKERPRHPYRNVLVATDFSEGSRHAVDAVVNLLPGTPFKLYHALELPTATGVLHTQTLINGFRQAAKQTGEEFLDDTAGLQDGQRPEILIEIGDSVSLLSEYAYKNHVDLVAVGTHGLTGILRTAIGSIAASLLENLSCDVLVVRQPHDADDDEI